MSLTLNVSSLLSEIPCHVIRLNKLGEILDRQMSDDLQPLLEESKFPLLQTFDFKGFHGSKEKLELCLQNQTVEVLECRRYGQNRLNYFRVLFKPTGLDEAILIIEDITDLNTMKVKEEKEDVLKKEILGMIVEGESKYVLIDHVCESFEKIYPKSNCSFLNYNSTHNTLDFTVGDRLPYFYRKLIHDIEVDLDAAFGARAAFFKKQVVVTNMQNHPNWRPYVKYIDQAGYKSCWSEPVLSSNRELFGVFTTYYKEQRKPNIPEMNLLHQLSEMIGLAIENSKYEQKLATSEHRFSEFTEKFPFVSVSIDRHHSEISLFGDTEGLVGYSESELQDMILSMEEHIVKSDLRRLKNELKESKKGDGCIDVEFRFRNNEAKLVWLNFVGKIYWENNTVRKIVGIAINIEKKKNVAENLIKAQILARNIEGRKIATYISKPS